MSDAALSVLMQDFSKRLDRTMKAMEELAPLGQAGPRLVEIGAKLDELIVLARNNNRRITDMAGEMAAMTAEVARTRAGVDSTKVLVANLRQQIIDAGTDPVALKALTDALDASNDELEALNTAIVTPGPNPAPTP